MFGHRSKTDTHTQTDPVCLISDPIHPTCKMVLFNAGIAGTVCACCCRCWIFLCFDVRHWFRSSRRLASVRGWRWTGHRCIGIERCPYKVVGLVTLMTCLCRYKVLLLKPHLRDMLASARRQRAFMGFPCFFSWSDNICKWCKQQKAHEMREMWFYWWWDWQDVKEPSPSQSRHRASRKGRDSEALRDWNDEFHEAVYRCI